MGDGQERFINVLVNIVKEGKAKIDEENKTISFKGKHWEESKDRIMASSPHGALFLFNNMDHMRGLYKKIKGRMN